MTLFVAALPPPVGGQSVVNARVLRAIEESGVPVKCVNVSRVLRATERSEVLTKRIEVFKVEDIPKIKYHYARAKKYWKAAKLVLVEDEQQTLYCVFEAGWGMLYTLFLMAIAKFSGRRAVLHHHSAAHFARFSVIFWIISRLAGQTATHIVLSDRMQMDLVSRYKVAHSIVCWNAAVVSERTIRTRVENAWFRMGHLSYLGRDKGTLKVLEVFRRLASPQRSVELVLAGPIVDSETENAIQAAQREFGTRIRYMGPVFGDDKDTFYKNIDVFLFPSKLKIEAQPIVLLEAFSYGVPCITTTQGYIDEIVGECGVCVPMSDYVQTCTKLISTWLESPSEWAIESEKARQRFQSLHQLAALQEAQLVEILAGPPSGRADNGGSSDSIS